MKTEAKKITLDSSFRVDPLNWLESEAKKLGAEWVFVIADDQVGFCGFKNNSLTIQEKTRALFTPICLKKIQQLFIFGEYSQLHIWCAGNGEYFASLIADDPASSENSTEIPNHIDEIYYLWGDAQADLVSQGFTRLSEEGRGFSFDLPKVLKKDCHAGFSIRHYIQEDEDGQRFIAFSRLTGLTELLRG